MLTMPLSVPLRGRPPLSEARRRTKHLTMRATEAEVDVAYCLALRQDRPLSEVLREGIALVLKAEADLKRMLAATAASTHRRRHDDVDGD